MNTDYDHQHNHQSKKKERRVIPVAGSSLKTLSVSHKAINENIKEVVGVKKELLNIPKRELTTINLEIQGVKGLSSLEAKAG